MTGLTVRCTGLRHVYPLAGADVLALDGVTFTVPAGRTAAVIGPSGSGKSTLLTLLAGLQRPTAGQVCVGEQDLALLSQVALLRVRAEQVAAAVQNPTRNLLPFTDAVANIRFAQRGPRSYRSRRLPDPDTLLRDLGLQQLARDRVDRLSGGERQRVALAVALSTAPGVLLADEPTSQLDTANRDRVIELLRYANQRYGTTVVVVTHDPDVAGRLDQSIGLHEGRLVQGMS